MISAEKSLPVVEMDTSPYQYIMIQKAKFGCPFKKLLCLLLVQDDPPPELIAFGDQDDLASELIAFGEIQYYTPESLPTIEVALLQLRDYLHDNSEDLEARLEAQNEKEDWEYAKLRECVSFDRYVREQDAYSLSAEYYLTESGWKLQILVRSVDFRALQSTHVQNLMEKYANRLHMVLPLFNIEFEGHIKLY